MKISDIGEQGLLQRLQQFCPSEIIGDDCALIPTHPDKLLVVTTDLLIDNVHFSDRTTSPQDVGFRAASANLSDLAAMGAKPLGITVGLGLPKDLDVNWVEEVYQGLIQCLNTYNTPIVGGDVVKSNVVTLAITAFGEVSPNFAIKRSTAKVGDAILITGYHGLSKAGLEILLNPTIGESLNKEDQQTLIKAHQRPKPRLDVIDILHLINTNNAIISGMDSSDGLADAIIQICRMSGVGAIIEKDLIPVNAIFKKWLKPEKALDWILYGGEDFELVLTLPLDLAETLVKQIGTAAAIIGQITSENHVILRNSENKTQKKLNLNDGFQHF
jgi:thiamine-monophosphate kinase